MNTPKSSRRNSVQHPEDLCAVIMWTPTTGETVYLSYNQVRAYVSDGWDRTSTYGIYGSPHLHCVLPRTWDAKSFLSAWTRQVTIRTGERSWASTPSSPG